MTPWSCSPPWLRWRRKLHAHTNATRQGWFEKESGECESRGMQGKDQETWRCRSPPSPNLRRLRVLARFLSSAVAMAEPSERKYAFRVRDLPKPRSRWEIPPYQGISTVGSGYRGFQVFNARQMRFGPSKYTSHKWALQNATPNWKWRRHLKSST